MTWVSVASRVVLFSTLSLFLGWFYGFPIETVGLVLALLVVFWIYQMRKVQNWLQDPDRPPPDAYGIWGDMLASVYMHQRKNREARSKLQANVKYLQDSFASMRDGVVMVDEAGAIKWFNNAVEPLLGLRYPDDVGSTLTNLVREPQFHRYLLAEDYQSPFQYTVPGERLLHLRVEITFFGEGERLLFVRDVSEAVRMEQIRRDFVANVSHELRTPLTVISGYLSTFLGTADDIPQRYMRPMEQMSQQAERMENLLKDLLWLSKIESEHSDRANDAVDIGGLLQELHDEMAVVYPERKLLLSLESRRTVQGDYRELYSAVSNLVHNAIKYSPESTAVKVHWYSKGNDCIVDVIDEGIGIDSLHLPRLTERFYRVDDSRSSTTGGTGLGLAIVKHVVAAYGGELRIQSEVSRGSTFSLIFPEGGTGSA